jgi:hypothetical protein
MGLRTYDFVIVFAGMYASTFGYGNVEHCAYLYVAIW